MVRALVLAWTGLAAIAMVVSCSANSNDDVFAKAGGAGSGGSGQGGSFLMGGSGGSGGLGAGGSLIDSGTIVPGSDCAESAKKVYLVTQEQDLWSFNPEIEGMDAYAKIGHLNCKATLTPQSMSVDRAGHAYVFFSSGELFLVSTTDAGCTDLPDYKHPLNCAAGCQLGMGFTADAPSSSGQILYIQAPGFGLATIDTKTLAVDKKNVFNGLAAELTGGADAKLFRFAAKTAELAEVTQGTWEVNPLHTFDLKDVMAWAFARYAGKFYMFTASGTTTVSPSKTTVYDPDTQEESTRDPNLGMTVVGAGQSTCVPPPMPK